MAVFQATATGDYILSLTASAECSSESRIFYQVYVDGTSFTCTGWAKIKGVKT